MAAKLVSEINAQIAESLFGWKGIRRDENQLIGKKPDKLGRMRSAPVPDYAGDPRLSKAIDDRMKELGKEAAYLKALAKIAQAQKLPVEWATPEQRSRAALSIFAKRRKK